MIVKMNKVTIVGLMEERSAIVKRLMKLGVVELQKMDIKEEDKPLVLEMAQYDDATRRISEIEDELQKIQSSITFLMENSPDKAIKPSKTELSFEDFVDPETYSGAWEKVYKINSLQKRLLDKKNKYSNLKNERLSLSVWHKLQSSLELMETKTCSLFIGTIPENAIIEDLLSDIDDIGCTVYEILNSDVDQSYLSLITHNSNLNVISNKLNEYGFSKANFGGLVGTVTKNINRIDADIKTVEDEIQEIHILTEEQYSDLPEIQSFYDYIFNMQERRKIRGDFLKTDKTFLVAGWTPSDLSKTIKNDLENSFCVCVETKVPDEDEETPVLLKNNSLVYPFEMITEMYNLPSSKGIDPNAAMAPFYWLFFGLMLSDAGYGILLSLLCGAAIFKLKTEKGTIMDKMLKMLFLCGLSTVLWGAAFGGWFGDLSFQLFNHEIKPLWFNPNNDPMRLLIWSFVFGSIHLLVGMALSAYMMIRDGKWLDAIFDIGLWYAVLIGIGILFLGEPAATIGKYMIISGAIGLVLTQGRKEKHILKKISTGILSLYNITGFMSDVLSYSRLLALGLATGVIAMVINQLAKLTGGFTSVITAIFTVIILIGGHIFNLAINTLGAYVHSSRLQYVEFFGKFYESGGKAFTPLKSKVKYIKLK